MNYYDRIKGVAFDSLISRSGGYETTSRSKNLLDKSKPLCKFLETVELVEFIMLHYQENAKARIFMDYKGAGLKVN